jgi:hypothetical protein
VKNYQNIEKSAFHKGEYVGYALGTVWRIRKTNSVYGSWIATSRDIIKNNVYSHNAYANRLSDMSGKLAALYY